MEWGKDHVLVRDKALISRLELLLPPREDVYTYLATAMYAVLAGERK